MVATASRPERARSAGAPVPGRSSTETRRSAKSDARPSLKVVRASAPAPAPRIRRAVVVVAILFAVVLLFGVAASHVVLAQNQSRLDALDKRARAAQATYAKLRYEVAELESPERVIAEAQRRFGMVAPVDVTYVNAPPAPATAVAATTAAGGDDASEASVGDWRRVKAELAGR